MDAQLIIILVIVAVAVLAGAALVVSRRSGSDDGGTPTATMPPPPVEAAPELRSRLTRTRSALSSALAGVFSDSGISDATWADMEDALIAADVGPTAAAEIVDEVRSARPESGAAAREALADTLIATLERTDRTLALSGAPSVIVVVGVNGTGKTTSIAKLARSLSEDGHSVVLGAADTFRAAADTQLRTWGDRVGVPVVTGETGSDPASVAFDAYRQAVDDGADVVIIDTAGRLHSRSNLMDELGKIVRVLRREAGTIDETLLVLDGTVGQNGIVQAEAFTEVAGVTGVVLTKLDGTARGGVAVAIERSLGVPVKYIGVGEQMDDLIPFVPSDFVDALVSP